MGDLEVGEGDAKAATVIEFEVGQTLAALEREAIRHTLEAVGGNREAAASILGIGVATLYRRLKEMGDEGRDTDQCDGSPEPATDAQAGESVGPAATTGSSSSSKETPSEDAPSESAGSDADPAPPSV